MNPYQTIPARHPAKPTLSATDKVALSHALAPVLGGSIIVAVMTCVSFMAWNEPAGSIGLSVDDKRMITYGCLTLLLPVLTIIAFSIRSAVRIARPKSTTVQYAPSQQKAAA